MNEKPIKMTVTCYHCKETFECEPLERSAFRECPTCEGSNWVMAPAPENIEIYSHGSGKLKQDDNNA